MSKIRNLLMRRPPEPAAGDGGVSSLEPTQRLPLLPVSENRNPICKDDGPSLFAQQQNWDVSDVENIPCEENIPGHQDEFTNQRKDSKLNQCQNTLNQDRSYRSKSLQFTSKPATNLIPKQPMSPEQPQMMPAPIYPRTTANNSNNAEQQHQRKQQRQPSIKGINKGSLRQRAQSLIHSIDLLSGS